MKKYKSLSNINETFKKIIKVSLRDARKAHIVLDHLSDNEVYYSQAKQGNLKIEELNQ